MPKRKKHITKKEARRITAFAANVADLLNLGNWQIVVTNDPCPKYSMAQIEFIQDRYFAQISVSKRWKTYDDDEKMHTIVHEVCHLMHRNLNVVVMDDTSDVLSYTDHERLCTQYRRHVELMVDGLANFLVTNYKMRKAWNDAAAA